MITANIAKVKNELSRFLEAVRSGETVMILDRKRPIARISPLTGTDSMGTSARLLELEGQGLISRPSETGRDWVNELLSVSASAGHPCGALDALEKERSQSR